MNTSYVADHMLSTGKHYTAGQLGAELGISAIEASAKLWNIRHSKKYQCDCTNLPNRTVKVTAINGRSINTRSLWNLVIFNKPLSKEAA